MVLLSLASDIHCCNISTSPADVLVVAGDLTLRGNKQEFQWAEEWFSQQPQPTKLFLAGNHDTGAFRSPKEMKEILKTPRWVMDEEIDLDGLRMYFSPWSDIIPGCKWWAFPLYGGTHCEEKWSEIPEGLDILVLHQPPWGISDEHWITGERLGCRYLRWKLQKMKSPPKVVVVGHIHSGTKVTWPSQNVEGILYLNAAVCDESYSPANDRVILNYVPGGVPEVWLEDAHGQRSKMDDPSQETGPEEPAPSI